MLSQCHWAEASLYGKRMEDARQDRGLVYGKVKFIFKAICSYDVDHRICFKIHAQQEKDNLGFV